MQTPRLITPVFLHNSDRRTVPVAYRCSRLLLSKDRIKKSAGREDVWNESWLQIDLVQT